MTQFMNGPHGTERNEIYVMYRTASYRYWIVLQVRSSFLEWRTYSRKALNNPAACTTAEKAVDKLTENKQFPKILSSQKILVKK